MNIDDMSEDRLKKGFLVTKLKDGITIIRTAEGECVYRMILLVFYLLGCFDVRFYQVKYMDYMFFFNQSRRVVSFHTRDWNPFSMLAILVFSILNRLYVKNTITFDVNPRLVINIDNKNHAYVVNRRKK